MDARAALWVGTGTAVVMAVAMTCGVALSSARALADRPGTALAGTAVVVHGNPGSTVAPEPDDDRPETVSAPAPKDIGSSDTVESAPRHEPSTPKSTTPEKSLPSQTDESAQKKATRKSDSTATSPAQDGSYTPATGTDDKSADRGGRGDEQAAETHRGTKAEDLRERLHELADRWNKRLAERADRVTRFTDDGASVRWTDEHSGPEHPHFRSGPEKEQSPRSPDNGD